MLCQMSVKKNKKKEGAEIIRGEEGCVWNKQEECGIRSQSGVWPLRKLIFFYRFVLQCYLSLVHRVNDGVAALQIALMYAGCASPDPGGPVSTFVSHSYLLARR